MRADAYATALMAMGKEKALEFAENLPKGIDVYLIYSQKEQLITYRSIGLKDILIK